MRRSREILFGDDTAKLELLLTPIRDLDLDLRRSRVEPQVRRLRAELRREGITLRPHFYFSDYYGCVERQANIGLAFYDATALLQDVRHEATGVLHTDQDIRSILRHEFGHAFCYSYGLWRQEEFRRVFRVRGDFFKSYPRSERFRANPWSREFVNLNGDHYAQKHPDEDFAETVAAYLDRSRPWRQHHRHKPGALRKLEYVRAAIRRYGGARAPIRSDPARLHVPLEDMKMPVGEFLGARLRPYRRKAGGFIDPHLRKLFRYRTHGQANGKQPVTTWVRRHRRRLRDRIETWTGTNRRTVQDLLDKIQTRSGALRLALKKEESDGKLLDLTAFATRLVTQFEATGSYLA